MTLNVFEITPKRNVTFLNWRVVPGARVAAALGLAVCLAASVFGQGFARQDGSVPVPTDWSSRHVVYTGNFSNEQAAKMWSEPRVYAQWLVHGHMPVPSSYLSAALNQRVKDDSENKKPRAYPGTLTTALRADWAISLGTTGGVAQGVYPAKYNFDVTQTPSCTNDFMVYPVNAGTGNTRTKVIGTFTAVAATAAQTATITIGAINTVVTAGATDTGSTFTTTTNATTNAAHFAAAVNRSLSTTTLSRVVAVASGATATVYALTPGTGVTMTVAETLGDFSWAAVTAGTNGTQANIVGLNQLYTGSTSTSCGVLTFPEFTFSYASGVGAIANSPSISIDGTKLVYVENDALIGAILHVLTIPAPTATTEHPGCVTNSGTALPTCATTPVIPGFGTSTASDFMLPLGLTVTTNALTATVGALDSFSSVFVQYGTNKGYVGDDNGYLYSIDNVNSGTPAHTASWPVQLNTTAATFIASPTVDAGGTGYIFAGDSTGKLSAVSTTGTVLSTLAITANVTNGAIHDAPLIDSTNGYGYISVPCNGTDSALSQFTFANNGTLAARSAQATTEVGGCAAATINLSGTGLTDTPTPWYSYSPTADNLYYASPERGHMYFSSKSTGIHHIGMFAFASSFHPVAGTNTTTAVTLTMNNAFAGSGNVVTVTGVANGTSCTAANINGTWTLTSRTATTIVFTVTTTPGTAANCSYANAAVAVRPTAGSNVTTAVTLTVNNSLAVGEYVTVAGVANNGTCTNGATTINGRFPLTAATATSITFTATNGTPAAASTCVYTGATVASDAATMQGIASAAPYASIDWDPGITETTATGGRDTSPLIEFYNTNAVLKPTAGTNATTAVTLSVNHGFSVGDTVVVAGVANAGTCTNGATTINGTWVVTAISTAAVPFTVTFTVTTAPVASSTCSYAAATITGPTDMLFQGLGSAVNEILAIRIPFVTNAIATSPAIATNTTSTSGGTSGMVIDNNSTNAQAASVYFGNLTSSTGCGTGFCAVKLTQTALQ